MYRHLAFTFTFLRKLTSLLQRALIIISLQQNNESQIHFWLLPYSFRSYETRIWTLYLMLEKDYVPLEFSSFTKKIVLQTSLLNIMKTTLQMPILTFDEA
jgi:hypothetical protein